MAIEAGTVVWLKSGGPAMTVKNLYQQGLWVCDWFNENAVSEFIFSEAQLTEVEPETE